MCYMELSCLLARGKFFKWESRAITKHSSWAVFKNLELTLNFTK